ncbi:unnamed protein product [Hermetia illucens]|uniref:Uncharacterized protein n=1 Tax=Hermetia illucens TaxID=343691 RepID=A0A7R8YLT0_HERIL|nr:unnamed protein product [Hermetia illucens]
MEIKFLHLIFRIDFTTSFAFSHEFILQFDRALFKLISYIKFCILVPEKVGIVDIYIATLNVCQPSGIEEDLRPPSSSCSSEGGNLPRKRRSCAIGLT